MAEIVRMRKPEYQERAMNSLVDEIIDEKLKFGPGARRDVAFKTQPGQFDRNLPGGRRGNFTQTTNNPTQVRGIPQIELKRVTTKIQKDIQRLTKKPVVSRQFLTDLAKKQGYKQAEIRVLEQALDEIPGEKISTFQLNQKMNAGLVELGTKNTQTYADYNYLRDEVGYALDNNYTRLYTAPFKTNPRFHHFSNEVDNYFAHSRVEDIGDQRRIIELQSDLYQRKRYLNELEKGEDLTPGQRSKNNTLNDYRNSRYERVLKEEIRQA